MTKEVFSDMKTSHIDYVMQYIKDEGNIFPHITIFAEQRDKQSKNADKPGVIIIPIPNQMMKDDNSKEEFVKTMLPSVFKEIKKKFIAFGIAFISEAWIREAQKDFDIIKKDYHDLPITKEVMIVMIETKRNNETKIYEIIHSGLQVNETGMTDDITLKYLEEFDDTNDMSGRFCGLFKLFENA